MEKYTIIDFTKVLQEKIWEFPQCPVFADKKDLRIKVNTHQVFRVRNESTGEVRKVYIDTTGALFRAFRNVNFAAFYTESEHTDYFAYGYVPVSMPVRPRHPEIMRELAEFLFDYEG